MILNWQTLEEFIAESDRLGPGSPACNELWRDVLYQPSVSLDFELSPRSAQYAKQQMELYQEITGHVYLPGRDEMTQNIPIETLIAAPNAYNHADPHEHAKHCVAMALLVQEMALPRGARILELGSGWGFTQEFLASCGYETVGVEINADFVRSSNARFERLGFGARVHQGNFEDFNVSNIGTFDAIVAYEAFHHAVDPIRLLEKYIPLLTSHGLFALAAEPFNNYYRTWGLRLDPYAIYSIRKFGWFENGWSIEYMADLLGRFGMDARYIERPVNELTRYMIGRLSNQRKPYQFGFWHPAIADGWWMGWDYCSSKGRSNLVLPRIKTTGLGISVNNFSPSPLMVLSLVSGSEQGFSVQPGPSELIVDLPPSIEETDLTLGIISDTFCPAELGINADPRRLGIHVEAVRWL